MLQVSHVFCHVTQLRYNMKFKVLMFSQLIVISRKCTTLVDTNIFKTDWVVRSYYQKGISGIDLSMIL